MPTYSLLRGRIGMDIGIKLLPVMWVFLCIPRHAHPLFMNTVVPQAYRFMHTSIRACFFCFFYNPYMSLFIHYHGVVVIMH